MRTSVLTRSRWVSGGYSPMAAAPIPSRIFCQPKAALPTSILSLFYKYLPIVLLLQMHMQISRKNSVFRCFEMPLTCANFGRLALAASRRSQGCNRRGDVSLAVVEALAETTIVVIWGLKARALHHLPVSGSLSRFLAAGHWR
jgi:hypothetical protein